MSSAVEPAPLPRSPSITKDVVQEMAAKLDLRVRDKDEADFTEMLISAREVMEEVAGLDGKCLYERSCKPQTDHRLDFLPPVDYVRFPRTDIVRPSPAENPYNAWATKATVKSTGEEGESGPLSGKNVVLKVSVLLIAVGLTETSQG